MHILMVHNEYGRPSGEEHALRAIGELLQNHGHEVFWFLKSSKDIGHSLIGKTKAFFSGIYSPGSRAEMVRLLDGKKVDVVQVQNLYPLLSPSVLGPCRERRIPIVMRCPNYRMFCPNGLHLCKGIVCERCLGGKEWWCVLKNCEDNISKSLGYAVRSAVARFTRMIINNVTIFVVLSEFQKKRFVAGGIEPERVAIIPNISSHNRSPNMEQLGDAISFVGRLSPEKGVLDFLKAASLLPQYNFTVAGDTSSMAEIMHNTGSNITFLRYVTDERLDAFYRHSRIVVLPSLCFEGFPNVIVRAMIESKPVIASRIGALPEIVEDGKTGLLFEPGNARDLANKIRYLLEHPDLCRKMGKAGREKAMMMYHPEAIYAQLIAVYEKAIYMEKGKRLR
jgi:glycosyltransferase involved in cell wall biosynthesis